MATASDEALLQYATDDARIIVSQDDDFTRLHIQWQQSDSSHGGIMFVAKRLQGEAQISYIVQQLVFYEEAANAEAVDYSTEIANQLLYL